MRKILLTRDAVSMGDDARDNSLEIEVDENWKLAEIIDKILKINYLPKIMGGKATWSIAYDNPLGVIAQQWGKPKFIGSDVPQFPYTINNKYKDFNKLHFNYHAQEDPEMVFNVIKRFRTVF
jgi:hypothetical protein